MAGRRPFSAHGSPGADARFRPNSCICVGVSGPSPSPHGDLLAGPQSSVQAVPPKGSRGREREEAAMARSSIFAALEPARQRGADFTTSLEADCEIRIDRGRVEQAVLVLVDNATAYSPPGEPVHVSSYVSQDELVIEVRDRGPGIPAEEVPLIFERFHRAHGTADVGENPGAGLGLAIAHSIVTAAGSRCPRRAWAPRCASACPRPRTWPRRGPGAVAPVRRARGVSRRSYAASRRRRAGRAVRAVARCTARPRPRCRRRAVRAPGRRCRSADRARSAAAS